MKKFASIAVAVLIAITAFPLGVFAAEPEIVSVEFEDVSVLEYTRGYTDESGNYIYSDFLPSFTVTLKDGRVIQSQDNCVEIDGGWYYPGFDTTDQTNGNYWTGGNTYEITGNILDVCGTFNVTVTKSPIESIEINDVTVIENTFGYEDENGNYIYEWFNPDFTAVFTDGRVVQSQGNSIEIGGEWIGLSYDNSDQYNGNYWTAGNTYEVTASILGVSGTFNVTVLENPIASIEIGDVTVLENTNGYESADGHYIYDSFSPSLTVTLKDGGEISSQYGSIQLNGQSFLLDCDYSDQEEGNYWTAGNTYQVTGTILGISGTFNVTVTENPVESLVINDFSVMENTHGYEDENGHYIYTGFNPTFTVTLKDGGELVSQDDSIEIGGEIYHLSIDISDQYNGNYWTVGNTYEVCGTIFGVSDTFRISVIGSPVISLEVSDFSVMENTHGYEDESGHYIYSGFFPSFTVTLNDGSQVSSQGGGVEIDGMNYYINFDISDQCNGNYWTAGNTYAISGTVLGASDTFYVTVTENPVESLVINDISVVENTHGYEDENGHYIYNNLYPSITVTLKDGSQVSSQGSGIEINGEYYQINIDLGDQGNGYYWTAGNTYEVRGSLLGVSDTFNVTVTESPVVSLEISDVSIIENTHGYINGDGHYIYGGIYPEFTVTLKDGRVIKSQGSGIEIDKEYYWLGLDLSEQYEGNYWTVGNTYEVCGTLLGATAVMNVSIAENPVLRLEINDMSVIENTHGYEDENGNYIYDWFSPGFTVVFKDGSETTVVGSEIEIDGMQYVLELDSSEQYSGNYWTVGNTYEVCGSLMGITDTFNVTVIENPVVGVRINDCEIYENSCGYTNESGNYIYCEFIPGFTAVLKDGSEISTKTNKIEIDGQWYWLEYDLEDQYNGNYWTAGNTYEVRGTFLGASDTFNVKIAEVVIDHIIGDANGDGNVNGIDINYMKRALSGTFEKNIAMDINGDGKVNGSDINLLKRYLVGSYVI